jgi:hypothetical protein
MAESTAARPALLGPRFQKDTSVGACVGLTDIALIYPLAVLATRRENGMSLRDAVAARRLHSGAWTAGTLLIPCNPPLTLPATAACPAAVELAVTGYACVRRR